MAREYLDFLNDIVVAMGQVERLLAGMTFQQLAEDEQKILAVTKAVENIDGAAKRVPPEVRARYPEIEWRDMAGTRDRVAHGYFEVDLAVLWRVGTEIVPRLKPEMERVLAAEVRAREDEGQG